MSYISHVDYKKMMDGFKKGAPKSMLKEGLEQEGNAFTAGLAKAKKGQEFKIGDKAVKDTSNYDAPTEGTESKEYDGSWGMGESHPANDQWHEEFQATISGMGLAGEAEARVMKALDHTDPMAQYGSMQAAAAAREFVSDLGIADDDGYEPDTDADYEEPRDDFDMAGDFNDGEFWENEVKKLQEIAGVRSHDDGPEDEDSDEEREAGRKRREMDDEEAENAERDEFDENEVTGKYDWVAKGDGSHMRDPEVTAKVTVDKHHAELKPVFDAYQEAKNSDDHKVRNKAWKDLERVSTSWAGHEMLEAGMTKTQVGNLLSGYGYFEDWLPEFFQALDQELKGMAEGLHMPPLQATGQTIIANEDQAPFGMSVLSPDERKQLKEFIESYKTIKKEIAALLEKAGKDPKIMENAKKMGDEAVPAERPSHYNDPTKTPKHKSSNLGGDRTNLVMTKAEMWEGEESIEKALGEKLHSTFNKVTQMAIKQIVADGFDPSEAVSFLKMEIEEKAKQATMGQYDF